jgi:hypothetical protein
MLYMELDVAHEFGIDPDVYFARERASRVTLCAFVFGKRAIKAMSEWDNRPKTKKGKK